MLEIIHTPEELQRRAEVVVKRLEAMVTQGLPKNYLLNLEEDEPEELRDLVMVQLGLKPVATFLDTAFDTFDLFNPSNPEKTFLDDLCDPLNLGIKLEKDEMSAMVWSQEEVARTYLKHQELFDQAGWDGILSDLWVDRENFPEFMIWLNETGKMTLDGLLHGIPLRDAQTFEKYCEQMMIEASRLWQFASSHDIPKEVPQAPKYLIHLENNLNNCRDDFLRIASLSGDVDVGLCDYVAQLRPAEVPGFQYTTESAVPTEHEVTLSKLYNSSQFEQKYQQLLLSFHSD